MHSLFKSFKALQNVHHIFKFKTPANLTKQHLFLVYIHNLQIPKRPNLQYHIQTLNSQLGTFHFVHSFANSHSLTETQKEADSELAIKVQGILKKYRDCATRKTELALDYCISTVTEELILNVLRRHSSDWKPAYIFFNWISKTSQIPMGPNAYNEILDILGKMRRFDEVNNVLEEMSKREGLINEETYRVLVNRHSAAHKVEEAINIFYKRRELGLELDLVAFQKLLMCLCRYKHVEVAETLLHSEGNKFGVDIKTMNIVLNGWCVLGNTHEAKRFWKDIIASNCKPDLFTYGTFIKALTKKGKLGTALKLYRALWDEGFIPDVVICNCVIDALCFKKRIPEALEVFREMSEQGCSPNVATYNSLIKYICKIRRMDKVYELLDEMEEKSGNCMPNDITFNFLLKSLREPEDVPKVLDRMERNGCEMNIDTLNLILRLYVSWDNEEKVAYTWNKIEESGLGPDRRSYTIMIHGLHDKGKIDDALRYFADMRSRGMILEPRTEILVSSMTMKLKENETAQAKKDTMVNENLLELKHKKKVKKKVG